MQNQETKSSDGVEKGSISPSCILSPHLIHSQCSEIRTPDVEGDSHGERVLAWLGEKGERITGKGYTSLLFLIVIIFFQKSISYDQCGNIMAGFLFF